jgi:hypothetical protein
LGTYSYGRSTLTINEVSDVGSSLVLLLCGLGGIGIRMRLKISG